MCFRKKQKALDKSGGYGIIALLMVCAVIRGVAQFGSVLEWGSRGREFESRHSDQWKTLDFTYEIEGFPFFIYPESLEYLNVLGYFFKNRGIQPLKKPCRKGFFRTWQASKFGILKTENGLTDSEH